MAIMRHGRAPRAAARSSMMPFSASSHEDIFGNAIMRKRFYVSFSAIRCRLRGRMLCAGAWPPHNARLLFTIYADAISRFIIAAFPSFQQVTHAVMVQKTTSFEAFFDSPFLHFSMMAHVVVVRIDFANILLAYTGYYRHYFGINTHGLEAARVF